MKLISGADERTAAVTVLAGLLLVADVFHRGLPVGDETDSLRDIRISNAFSLAKQAVSYAERTQSDPQ